MKLTLNIEPILIDRIKEVAKKRNTSLSKVTEKLFKQEIENNTEPFKMKNMDELPEWIKSLTIAGDPVPDFDNKAEYHQYLEKKYGL